MSPIVHEGRNPLIQTTREALSLSSPLKVWIGYLANYYIADFHRNIHSCPFPFRLSEKSPKMSNMLVVVAWALKE